MADLPSLRAALLCCCLFHCRKVSFANLRDLAGFKPLIRTQVQSAPLRGFSQGQARSFARRLEPRPVFLLRHVGERTAWRDAVSRRLWRSAAFPLDMALRRKVELTA